MQSIRLKKLVKILALPSILIFAMSNNYTMQQSRPIPSLLDKTATVLLQKLKSDCQKHKIYEVDDLERAIVDCVPADVCETLAKKWFLRHDYRVKSYPFHKMDFGFSIEELRRAHKIPAIRWVASDSSNTLDLSNLRINDLSGLLNIEGIEDITSLKLSHNKIKKLDYSAFSGLRSCFVKTAHLTA